MTATEALAAWEAADARKRAAKQEQQDADAAWVVAAEALAEAINTALPDHNHRPVMIGGKVVSVVWDDYWAVSVEAPPVLS